MTEKEWQTTSDLPAMMIFLRGELTPVEKLQTTGLHSGGRRLAPGPVQQTTSARLRAFALACLPLWRELPLDERNRASIDDYEAFLTGGITHEAFCESCVARQNALAAEQQPWFHAICVWWNDTPLGIAQMVWNLSSSFAAYAAQDEIIERERNASDDDLFAWGFFGYHDVPIWRETYDRINKNFAFLLRETIGNPFHSIVFSPSWRTDTTLSLARAIYDSHDFRAMPILADAIQDAGCDNNDILSHCRDMKQTHVHGCWVVDLVLGKQ